ncbi:MAG: LamG domain-containing protein [Planctomycetota bacterium]|jgi:hypothetical protein
MSKKLLVLISLVAVLALALPASAAETLLASYEPNEVNDGDLFVRVNDEAGNLTVNTTWPMLQGTDACSLDPNFGPGVTVPNATDGNYVLGFSWVNETDGRADLHHEFLLSTFDLLNNDEIRIDVYIDGPNDMGVDRIDLWDIELGWVLGEFEKDVNGDPVFEEWFPVTYDITEVKGRLTNHTELTTIYFGGQASDDGRVFFDNLRLWRPFGPKPSSPNPGNAATGVSRGAGLSWTQGEFAASHDIYFGTDPCDVRDANNSWPVGTSDPADPNVYKGNQAVANTSYDLQLLAPGTDYYWRVDAVNGVSIWEGDPWSFTTGQHLVVDDFDSYSNDAALWTVWEDFWTNGTDSEIWLETDANFTRDGNSIKFQYESITKSKNKYVGSVIDADVTGLQAGTDWTAGGTEAIVLYFYGQTGNAVGTNERMWVQLDDTSSNTGLVIYDGDHNDFAEPMWHEWDINLGIFDACGVNRAYADKLHIGSGGQDLTGQSGDGGSGIVYFDDIRLSAPWCRPEFGPVGDFDDDCAVTGTDVGVLSGDWLDTAYDVNAEAPNSLNLRAHYKFDEGSGHIASDSSVNGYDANITDGLSTHWDTNGYDTNCIYFGGEYAPAGGFRAKVIDAAGLFGTVSDDITISCWINGDLLLPNWPILLHARAADTTDLLSVLVRGDDHGLSFITDQNDVGHTTWYCEPDDYVGSWNQYAFVKDGTASKMYHDGALVAESSVDATVSGIAEFVIGGMAQDGQDWANYTGRVDEVRIYDYALSQSEVLNLAGYTVGQTFHQPLFSPANAYDADEVIDFKDYDMMANNWLIDPVLWP